MDDSRALLARKEISLNCERIARGNSAIRPETTMQKIPIVFSGATALSGQGTVVEIIRKDPVVCFFLDGPPILNRVPRLSLRTSFGRDESARRVRGALRYNVDDPVDGIGPPDRRARPANHFDPVNIFERYVQRIPVHAAQKGRVNGPPVNEDKHFV